MVARHIVPSAMFLPDGTERQSFCFLEESQPTGEVPGLLRFPQEGCRFQQRGQERLQGASGANRPRGDPVDAGIEKVETDVGAVEKSPTDHFLHDRLDWIIQKHDVVAVPAHPPADM